MEELSFEAALERLQQTVAKLESGTLSLDDSLKCFEEGVQLTRKCHQHLTTAEQKIELLKQTSAGKAELQPFTVPKS